MHLLLLLPLSALLLVDALLNVTVDDVSPRIAYAGNWEPSALHKSATDFGGSHTLSGDERGSATFLFTGVAVYYLSPRWPYDVNTRLSLDGEAPVLVNLTDPNSPPEPPGGPDSAPSSVVWSATSLANKSHTLVATIGNLIIVDGFIYTVDNSSSTTSSAASSTSASASSSATLAASSAGSSVAPSKHSGVTIGLATALALSVLLVGLLLAFGFFYRRRQRKSRSARPQPILDDWGSTLRGRGRGAYAAVGTGHGAAMSDTSSSNLLTYTPVPGLLDPWDLESMSAVSRVPSSTSGVHSQTPSAASYG
ncbi:hypothetical protein B0H15DRAFT_908651, partial [Mycena belliarum]